MAVKTELTGEDLEHFRKNGYLVLPQTFNAEEVARMQHEADRILELIINSSLANGRKSGRLNILQTSTGPMVRKIQPVNDLSLFLAEVSADERLIGPMRQLMGDEPILMEEKLNYKEPLPEAIEGIPLVDSEDRFPVHNDWAYYLAQDYPQEIISSAVTMDPCDESSGPLHVWPGSHKQHLEHHQPPNKRGWGSAAGFDRFRWGNRPVGAARHRHALPFGAGPQLQTKCFRSSAEAHDLQPLPQAKRHRARCKERAQQASRIALRVGVSAGEGPR